MIGFVPISVPGCLGIIWKQSIEYEVWLDPHHTNSKSFDALKFPLRRSNWTISKTLLAGEGIAQDTVTRTAMPKNCK